MPSRTPDEKHEAFLRLMQRRLERTLNEMRLVAQLSSEAYDNTAEEAQEVVMLLNNSLRRIATNFKVPYFSDIGTPVLEGPKNTGHINEIDIAKAIDLINQGHSDQAKTVLKAALNQEAR